VSSPAQLTRRQLNRATLARQLLVERAELSALDAIERLCAIQAQEARPPYVGLWTRLAGFRREDLHDLLHKRTVVRATFLRGTLHVVAARDYAAFRAALRPVMAEAVKVLGSRAKGLEPEKVLPVATELYREAPRTFNALRPLLVKAFPEVNERALGYVVRTHLPLVMVPTADRWGYPAVSEFALASDWLAEPLSEDEAPTELVRRYLAAFGPATAVDMQTWSGIGGLKSVLARLRPELEMFTDDKGRELFDLPDAPRPDPDLPVPVRFLPEFDNLVLSHGDRTRVIADEYRGQVVTKNLRVRATVLHDGFVCGTWEVDRKKTSATLRVTPFHRLPAGVAEQFAEEGEQLLRFVEPDAATIGVQVVEPLS
jgi:hypothetical protein